MADVELRISADAGDASKEISGFRKEYVELVKAVEKPLRQVDALQKTTENAKAATAAYFDAKRRVDELKRAIEQAGQPVRELDRAYAQAQRTLASATREFDRQKTKVREQRAELKAAGVDVRNLAAEQQRLRGALAGAVGQGRADAAITGALDQFGVNQLRNLRTQLVALDSDYRRLTASANLSARERITAEIQYQAQVNKTRAAIRELETGYEQEGGGIQALAGRLAAVTAAAYAVSRVASAFFNIADSVATMEDRLRAAVQTQDEYDRSLARLEETSKRVRIPLAQTSELFIGAAGPLREMGFSAAMTAEMVAALAAGLVTSNVKGQQAEAVINQLSQGLQTGTIRGDAFNAMLTKAPTLIKALTDGLEVSREELIRMAAAGELTTEKFVTALSKQSEELLKLADNMRSTVQDAQGTFSDSIDKVVGALDKLFKFSEKAVNELDKVSGALDGLAEGKAGDFFDVLAEKAANVTTSLFPGARGLLEGYRTWSDSTQEAIEEVVSAEEEAARRIEELNEQTQAAKRAYAAEFNKISADLAVKFKNSLDDQVAAQRKANSELGKARNAQLETEKRYKAALEKLRVGATGPASYNNAQTLQVAARDALRRNDVEGAKRNAQAALKMLTELAEAGENTYGFAGMIQGLQAIEQEADKINVDNAEKSFEAARKKTQEWKKELEALKNFTIVPEISDQALADEAAKLRKWAQTIGLDVSLAPRVLPSDAPSSALSAGLGAAQPSAIIDPKAKAAPGAAVPVPAKPQWVRDGNSFTDPVEVAAKPKWVQDGNSFGDAIPVEAKVVGIRQDGENSFTNLPPVDVELGIDEASATAAVQAVEGIAQVLRQKLQVPISVGPVTSGPQDAAGFSAGGWTGPGTKYQPAGVVHADEHVQPKEVVNEPGALPFLERIRRHGFRNTISELRAQLAAGKRGYATGGLVAPGRALPAIPPLAPALQQQLDGPSFPDLGRIAFEFGGEQFNLYGSQGDAMNLQRLVAKFGRTRP